MILADTNVWIAHLRRPDEEFIHRLRTDGILCHRLVIGELACGSLPDRGKTLRYLRRLPQARRVPDDDVLVFIERHALAAIGIGFLDAHLLAATAATPGARFWTRDTRLDAAAARLGLRHVRDA